MRFYGFDRLSVGQILLVGFDCQGTRVSRLVRYQFHLRLANNELCRINGTNGCHVSLLGSNERSQGLLHDLLRVLVNRAAIWGVGAHLLGLPWAFSGPVSGRPAEARGNIVEQEPSPNSTAAFSSFGSK